MQSKELRQKFLKFFEDKGHTIIPSAPLIPSEEQQLMGKEKVLFTSAGMQPLIPYLTGKAKPPSRKLANCQKCLRTDDIEQVGDLVHHTFFEMLGNWSIGGAYWKEEAIEMSFNFLTKELNIPVKKLAVSVFAGDKDAPRDEESAKIWEQLGIPKGRIFYLGKEHNWWPSAKKEQDSGEFKNPFGPCGPDTEMFYWTGEDEPQDSPDKNNRWVEIWNDVFMEFERKEDGSLVELPQKNIDTGMGLERVLAVLNGEKSAYDTELFAEALNRIKSRSKIFEIKKARIIADHLKAATFLISEGVQPLSADKRGSVLVRLIDKAISNLRDLGIKGSILSWITDAFIDVYNATYSDLSLNRDAINTTISHVEERYIFKSLSEKAVSQQRNEIKKITSLKTPDHIEKFIATRMSLASGTQVKPEEITTIFPDMSTTASGVSGIVSADMKETYGIQPAEFLKLASEEIPKFNLIEAENNLRIRESVHRKVSKKGGQKAKGGLAVRSNQAARLHTATHLLHQALRDVLGKHVHQTGSHITDERLRFDFTHSDKMTDQEIKEVEKIVNQKITEKIPVAKKLMTQEEADKIGAIGLFRQKYGDKVSIYLIGDYSAEYCGGPHAASTGQLGIFNIIKEESAGSGIRRIYAKIVTNN